ncbi:hypothetical protein M405DRAFT_869831, partial [Rhizopogon salebrosus TDB-379]
LFLARLITFSNLNRFTRSDHRWNRLFEYYTPIGNRLRKDRSQPVLDRFFIIREGTQPATGLFLKPGNCNCSPVFWGPVLVRLRSFLRSGNRTFKHYLPSVYPPCPPRTLLALCVPSLPSAYPPCPPRTLLALCIPSLPSAYPPCPPCTLLALCIPSLPSVYPPCPPSTLLALHVPSLPSVYPPCPLSTLLALCIPSLPSAYPPCPLHTLLALCSGGSDRLSFVEQLENSHPCTCAKDHSSKNNLPTVKGHTTTLPAPPTCCTLKQPSLLHPAAIR